MNFQVKHKRFIDNGGSMPLHGPRPVLEYAVSEIMSFSFDFDLAPETRYTLSGDTEPLRSGEPMFLAEGTLLEGRSLRFEVNTLTRSFHDKCRNFHHSLIKHPSIMFPEINALFQIIIRRGNRHVHGIFL